MNNNDILRRLRYSFDLDNTEVIDHFALANVQVTNQEVNLWLKKDDDEEQVELSDFYLAAFLNGLIVNNRGKKDDSEVVNETQLTNNIILRKLKIACEFVDTDILELLELAGMQISRHELSALFRSPSNSKYRECKDQFLRNFLRGLQLRYRSSHP